MTSNGARPRLRPTNPASLVVGALAAAAVGWLIIARDYGDFPTITWIPALLFAGLGLLEIIAAATTKARVDRKPGAAPVEPLTVMRYVLLAKASSMGAAVFTGFFASVLVWLLGQPRDAGSHTASDLPPAAGGLGGAILLLVAALLLERACRVPPQPEDEDSDD
jgi:Protein of unknown function (DUF3180)